jgi:hypothetical protein
MVVRGNRVFPVGYDWARLAGICALAAGLFALGELLFAPRGASEVVGRLAVAALLAPLALIADRAARRAAPRP